MGDTKPLTLIGKSDIAKRAETAELRMEAKQEAEGQSRTL